MYFPSILALLAWDIKLPAATCVLECRVRNASTSAKSTLYFYYYLVWGCNLYFTGISASGKDIYEQWSEKRYLFIETRSRCVY